MRNPQLTFIVSCEAALKSFSPNIRNKTKIPTFTTAFQIVVILYRAVRQEKQRGDILIERNKVSLFTDNMILCVENPERLHTNTHHVLLELINRFEKVARRKIKNQL